MGEDWFRSSDWDDASKAEFEKRLGRTRLQNRPQYLRVKALALLECGDDRGEEGQQLLRRLIQEHPDAMEVPLAHELLAESYARQGDLTAASRHFRACLSAAGPSRSGTSGVPDLGLAEVLIEANEPEALDEARRLLESDDLRKHLSWNVHVFRYFKANAELAHSQGRFADAAAFAKQALDAAKSDTPQLDRHPDVGRVVADIETLRRLKELAHTE